MCQCAYCLTKKYIIIITSESTLFIITCESTLFIITCEITYTMYK